MYILQRWNYETQQYEPHISTAEILFLFTEDLDSPIDCASCGKRKVYGECYTSKTIHNNSGIGFWVCESCYEQELRDEEHWRNPKGSNDGS